MGIKDFLIVVFTATWLGFVMGITFFGAYSLARYFGVL